MRTHLLDNPDEQNNRCPLHTSNGSILIYGDEMKCNAKAGEYHDDGGEGDRDETISTNPLVALTMYEDLLNVSDINELRFAGDGVGRYVPRTQFICQISSQRLT